jgi:hypothetical protein
VAYYASFVLSIVKIFSCFKTKLSFQNQVFFEPTIPNLHNLTPKGPNVHMVDKPVLVSVTWAHTIFRNFETFCEDASYSKLHRGKKSYFLDLRIKSYGCLKFWGEVWVGRACAGANQQELTTSAQKGGQ